MNELFKIKKNQYCPGHIIITSDVQPELKGGSIKIHNGNNLTRLYPFITKF